MASIAKTLQQSDLGARGYFAAKPWPAASNARLRLTRRQGIGHVHALPSGELPGRHLVAADRGLNYDYMFAAMRSFANEELTNNMDMVKIMSCSATASVTRWRAISRVEIVRAQGG